MNLLEDITLQLDKQKIEYRILFSIVDRKIQGDQNLLTRIIDKWKNEFVRKKTVPYIEQYLWHVFSYKMREFKEGHQALENYKKQFKAKTYIFNQLQTYLIECIDSIPIIELENYLDDIYICHHNMKWTYVLPHEMPSIGPFYATKL